ncbi:J domain-containing protein [Citrus sinensis]|uniref:J domain-containing protein n=2 Tax=Citrus sinensis TaxID=2711 RepID=A0ACB8KG58_CITSI|nr:J domain-containing protein [Citrus sinensis]
MPVMALGTRGSLYEVLRVEPKATISEIKTAKVYHPDLSGNGRDFTEIHNTYETLLDPKAKAVYDMSLVSRRRTRTTSFGCSGRSGFHPTRRWETDQCWYEFSI